MSTFDLNVIYADDVLLAVEKPQGLLVHGDGTGAHTLTDDVTAWLADNGRDPVATRPQAVQRLDVETTGLVLFSLDAAMQPALDAQVAGRSMEKTYLAVVAGRFPWSARDVDDPVGRDRHDARRMRACRPGQGKPALTHVRRLAFSHGRSLLAVGIETGRRHQIRVHLASLGFPIVGDTLYGGARPDARRGENGLLLHAWRETLSHPATGEPLVLQTPWPERLGSWDPACVK